MNISKSYITGKIVPAAMSGALALSMAVPSAAALAESYAGSAAPEPTDVTISAPADDTHTYDVYQIFTGNVSTTENTKLSNIAAGANAKGLDTEAKVNAAAEELAGVVDAATDSAKLAVIEKYVDLTTAPAATVTKDQSATVKSGYYLIKDHDASITGYDAYTLYIAKVVGDDVTIERKAAVPSVTKAIVNGTAAGHIDLDAGDAVTYRLTGTMPSNLDDYTTYKYCFNDTLAAGLTRCAAGNVKVTMGGTDVTGSFTVSDVTDGGLFTVSCDNVKTISGINADSTLEVSYTATVNDAATAAKAGNANKVTLTFSNNPNTGYESSLASTPETDEATVEVHTYDLLISKTKADGAALAGAGFTLYKLENGNYTAVGGEVTGTGDDANQFNWHGLGTGSYKLVETTTPNGYNTIKDVTFDVVTTYDGDVLTGLSATNVSDADGALGDDAITANVDTGLMSASVVNVDGTILPTTGSTGIVILAAGAVLVLGCAAACRIRRRGDAEE